MVTCYNTPNQYHLAAALGILSSPDSAWSSVENGGEDEFADQIVDKCQQDPVAVYMVQGDPRKSKLEADPEIALRQGWALLKAVFGEAVAVPLICKVGALAAISGLRTLGVVNDADETKRAAISIASTIVSNLVEVVAEYNNMEGAEVLPHVLIDIPLNEQDRKMVQSISRMIDYSKMSLN